MTDRERLIAVLNEIENDVGFICDSCGESKKSICIESFANRLITHGVYVREPQKPCKFEEISSGGYCWVEYKYEFYTSVEMACVLCKTSEYCGIDFVGHGSSITHRKELYNETWRCWAEKPTEAERKNAKWEE